MGDIDKIEFNVRIYFSNGVTVEKCVPVSKAFKLSTKDNVIIPDDTDYVELYGVSSSIVIPLNMTFVINASPDFRDTESVSRYMLYKRDNGKCAYCGRELSKKEATLDHIIPRSRGGKTEWKNVALSCKRCNTRKNDRTPKEAGMPLKVTPFNPKLKR